MATGERRATERPGSRAAGLTSSVARPAMPVVLWLAGTAILAGVAWLVMENGRPIELATAFVLVPFAFLTAGMIAWRRRPDRRLGILLMLVAAPYLLAIPRFGIVEISIVGAFLLPASDVIQAYVLLAFPNDRIMGQLDRGGMAILAGAFGLYVVLTAITLEPEVHVPAACPPCGPNPLRVVDDLDAGALVQTVFGAVLLVAVLLVIGLIIRRWVVATGPARRVLAPVLFGGVVFAVGIATRQIIGRLGENELIPHLDVGSAAVRALVPVGLVTTFLRLQSARDAVVGTAVQVGTGLSAAGLEVELRRALHDPRLTVGTWSDTAGAYLDREGQRVAPEGDGTQAAIRLDRDGRPLAVVLRDPAIDDPAIVEAISATVRLAVDASRLRDRLEARGSDVADLPRGEVSFVFGDIERSTELLARVGDRYVEVLDSLRSIVRKAAAAHDGHVVEVRADEFFLAFARPADAIAGAIRVVAATAAARPAGERFRVRLGVHRGHPKVTEESYVGLDVHIAARVMAAANGDQVIASRSAVDEAGDLAGVTFRELGTYRLKGVPEPVELVQIVAPDLPTDDRPARAERVRRPGFGDG